MRVIRGCSTSFFSSLWFGPILMAVMVMTGPRCMGQAGPAGNLLDSSQDDYVVIHGASDLDSSLPDAPLPQQQTKPDPDADKPLVAATPKTVSQTTQMPVAPKYSKYIPAGYAVEQIHGKEKLVMGARDLYSVGDIGDWFLASAWSQLWNGQPNYGTDRGAYGERLGAAAIKETTDGILTDGVFCVMLHQDPRYFVQGEQTGLMHRAIYVVTRPFVTRSSNDGHAMPNYSLWLALATSTALSNAYYPQINRNARDNAARYASSFGGTALGYAFDEFSGDLLKKLHHKRQ